MKNDLPLFLNHQKFNEFLQSVIDRDFSFVIYRFPNQKKLNFLFSQNHFQKKNINQINKKESLFLLSDFFWKKNQTSTSHYFHTLNPDLIYQTQMGTTKGKYLKGNPKILDSFLQRPIQPIESTINSIKKNFPKNKNQKIVSTLKKEYLSQVEYIKKKIAENKVEKVVLSKIKKKKISQMFNGLEIFDQLLEKYPNCLVYLLYDPKIGYWISATPEILISETSDKNWQIMSLAGTQVYKPTLPVEKTAWQQKEIREQALVTNYIINCFKQIRLRAFKIMGPQTVRVGNLLHLLTTLVVKVNEVKKSISWFPLVKLLQPTSAVCGMPKEESLKIISKLEKHSRKIYTGLVGIQNLDPLNALYVNLRCVKIDLEKQIAFFYSGAGITEDSDPKKEWQETEDKIAFLESLIC